MLHCIIESHTINMTAISDKLRLKLLQCNMDYPRFWHNGRFRRDLWK
jgi:hypothetical protein